MKTLPKILDQHPLVLGSGSPRRKALLEELGFRPHIAKADVDETVPPEIATADAGVWLARLKADALAGKISPEHLLLTADTLVLFEGELLAKPRDLAEAKGMLMRLAGQAHEVVTGVCLRLGGKESCFESRTRVWFYPLGEEVIDYYLAHYEALDKAGAYGIQAWLGMAAVERIEGCFFNVMGLPTPRLMQVLTEWPLPSRP